MQPEIWNKFTDTKDFFLDSLMTEQAGIFLSYINESQEFS